MSVCFILGWLAFMVGVVVMLVRIAHQHSDEAFLRLSQWAEREGLTVHAAEHRRYLRGPYWLASKYQAVFHVLVTLRTGEERAGWVCFGSFFRGLRADDVRTRWDPASRALRSGRR